MVNRGGVADSSAAPLGLVFRHDARRLLTPHMKGIVFTEFFELVESAHGIEMVDRLIDECDLPSGGVYTAVGTYDHTEIVALVSRLSEVTGTPVPDLLKAYGEFLFGRFVELYPELFEGIDDTFSFLERVETYIHVEVRKLYESAELPTFDTRRIDGSTLEMIYRSGRHFEDLAEGLIRGCIKHYDEPCEIQRDPPDRDGGIRFAITKT